MPWKDKIEEKKWEQCILLNKEPIRFISSREESKINKNYECSFSQKNIMQLHWGGDHNELNEIKVAKAAKTPKSLQIELYRYLQSWTI